MSEGMAGGCQCGAVRWRLASRPKATTICHCRMCQKAGGGPFMVFGGVATADFSITRGTLSIYRSSEHAERGFCAACGTPLTYRRIGGERVSVSIGGADQPELMIPVDQLGVEARSPWTLTINDLPEQRTLDWLKTFGKTDVDSHQHPDHET